MLWRWTGGLYFCFASYFLTLLLVMVAFNNTLFVLVFFTFVLTYSTSIYEPTMFVFNDWEISQASHVCVRCVLALLPMKFLDRRVACYVPKRYSNTVDEQMSGQFLVIVNWCPCVRWFETSYLIHLLESWIKMNVFGEGFPHTSVQWMCSTICWKNFCRNALRWNWEAPSRCVVWASTSVDDQDTWVVCQNFGMDIISLAYKRLARTFSHISTFWLITQFA